MTPNLRWFATAGVEDLIRRFQNWSGSQDGLFQYLVVLAVFLVVTLGAFIWAAFFRRHRRHHHHHHSHDRTPESPSGARVREGSSPPASASSHHHRRRRRRRRPEHPLNPTLAQTGGLPPLRSGEPGQSEPRA